MRKSNSNKILWTWLRKTRRVRHAAYYRIPSHVKFEVIELFTRTKWILEVAECSMSRFITRFMELLSTWRDEWLEYLLCRVISRENLPSLMISAHLIPIDRSIIIIIGTSGFAILSTCVRATTIVHLSINCTFFVPGESPERFTYDL